MINVNSQHSGIVGITITIKWPCDWICFPLALSRYNKGAWDRKNQQPLPSPDLGEIVKSLSSKPSVIICMTMKKQTPIWLYNLECIRYYSNLLFFQSQFYSDLDPVWKAGNLVSVLLIDSSLPNQHLRKDLLSLVQDLHWWSVFCPSILNMDLSDPSQPNQQRVLAGYGSPHVGCPPSVSVPTLWKPGHSLVMLERMEVQVIITAPHPLSRLGRSLLPTLLAQLLPLTSTEAFTPLLPPQEDTLGF